MREQQRLELTNLAHSVHESMMQEQQRVHEQMALDIKKEQEQIRLEVLKREEQHRAKMIEEERLLQEQLAITFQEERRAEEEHRRQLEEERKKKEEIFLRVQERDLQAQREKEELERKQKMQAELLLEIKQREAEEKMIFQQQQLEIARKQSEELRLQSEEKRKQRIAEISRKQEMEDILSKREQEKIRKQKELQETAQRQILLQQEETRRQAEQRRAIFKEMDRLKLQKQDLRTKLQLEELQKLQEENQLQLAQQAEVERLQKEARAQDVQTALQPPLDQEKLCQSTTQRDQHKMFYGAAKQQIAKIEAAQQQIYDPLQRCVFFSYEQKLNLQLPEVKLEKLSSRANLEFFVQQLHQQHQFQLEQLLALIQQQKNMNSPSLQQLKEIYQLELLLKPACEFIRNLGDLVAHLEETTKLRRQVKISIVEPGRDAALLKRMVAEKLEQCDQYQDVLETLLNEQAEKGNEKLEGIHQVLLLNDEFQIQLKEITSFQQFEFVCKRHEREVQGVELSLVE